MLTLYTMEGCPLCNVLKKKLALSKIEFVEESSEQKLRELGITSFPVLDVDGQQMNFSNAINWVKENTK